MPRILFPSLLISRALGNIPLEMYKPNYLQQIAIRIHISEMRDIFLHFRDFAVRLCAIYATVSFYHAWLLHTDIRRKSERVNIYLAVLQLIAQVYHKFSENGFRILPAIE